MLCIKRMALSHFADLVNLSFVDALDRVREVSLNEWLPVFLSDLPERIMAARPVQRPVSIQNHFLNQVFAAAKKEVADSAMILNHASQLSLHVVAAVFEDLLKFIEDDHDVRSALRGDFGRRLENFLENRCNPCVLRQAKRQRRFSFSIQSDARGQAAEEFLC